MPIPVTQEFRSSSRRGLFHAHYLAILLLTLHWACVLYVDSAYLDQFASNRTISILYAGSALLTMVVFLFAPFLLSRIGNVRFVLLGSAVECGALIGMAYAPSALSALTFFVLHEAVVPLLLFGLDIFAEQLVGDNETHTGRHRGILLTIMSVTTACAPLGIGYLLDDTSNYTLAYLSGALFLIPFCLLIVRAFGSFKDSPYVQIDLKHGIRQFLGNADIRNVFCAHFLLQLFFTWMVIYTPLYLLNEIGFNWQEIGSILFVGLTAYVFLEYLIGVIADTYIGEKEMMAFGFAITALSTSWFVFLDHASIGLWMFAMFLTRVGASLVETTTESYFFKHTQGKDTNLIGFFRISRPFSYVVGALLGAITLHLLNFGMLFVILGFLMIPGIFFAMALKDTK